MAASSNPLDLDVTVVSAKHLKNVNWRNGDLKPYVVLYLDSDHRVATHSDDSGSTRPVWNQRLTLPVTRPIRDSVLTLEIFHSRPSETLKPLVGSAQISLAHLVDSDESPNLLPALELIRPSGRPQGKIRVKLVLRERPSPPPPPPPSSSPQYHDDYNAPQNSYYYSSAPPPPPVAASPVRPYREYAPSPYAYSDQYYSSYYYAPPRPFYPRPPNYGLPGGPSAPVDLSSSDDHKPPPPRASNYGMPSGPSAPVDYSPYDQRQLQKGMGGLSLEDEKATDKAESETVTKESYTYGGDYRRNY